MGRDIPWTEFSQEDFEEFRHRLKQENRILMNWFKQGVFEPDKLLCGFELEAWLVDSRLRPAPINEAFLEAVDSPLVVPELAKFNFEINSTPQRLHPSTFFCFEEELREVWNRCQAQARRLEAEVLAIGILPTVTDAMLTLDNMSSVRRYFALNQQVMRLRRGRPLKIQIEGRDRLQVEHRDVMLESVATSLQIHLQVDPARAPVWYNLSQSVSAPMVAVAANSPFLFGKDLWDETRIPVFEQAVSVASFRHLKGETIGRVTFGTGYCRNSMFEPFLENLDGFPVLLPLVFDDDPSWMSHLRLHNGTIWRWNRPLIGLGAGGTPHLRIEHRTPAAGPSLPDIIANIAFFVGLVAGLARQEPDLPARLPFEQARENFYAAAKQGLKARIQWLDGRRWEIGPLILDRLLPLARQGLIDAGASPEEVRHYLDGIIGPRVETGQNGAAWQRAFIQRHGPCFEEMTRAYARNQSSNLPVHQWEV